MGKAKRVEGEGKLRERSMACAMLFCVLMVVGIPAEAGKLGYDGQHFLADMVTQDCLFLFSMPQHGALRKSINEVKVMGLAGEQEVQALWQDTLQFLDKELAGEYELGTEEMFARGELFAQVFDGQVSLAVFGLGARKAGYYYDPLEDLVHLLLLGDSAILLESSRPPEVVARALEGFAAGKLAREVWGGPFRKIQLGGRDAYESPEDSLPVYIAARGSAVVATTRIERLEQLLAAFDSPPQAALSSIPACRKAVAEVESEDVGIFAFWNIEEGLRRMEGAPEEEGKEEFEAPSAFWAAWRVEGERARFQARLSWSKGGLRLLDSFRSVPNPLATAALVPSTSLLYCSQTVDVGKLCDYFLDLIEEEEFGTAPPETGPAAEEWAEFHVTKKAIMLVAGQLGPEAALYASMPFGGGGFVPNAALVCEAGDPVALEEDLRSLLKLAEFDEFDEIPFQGYTIYSAPESDMPFGLNYAVLDRHLVLGITPMAVKEVIAHQKNPAGSLGQAEGFRAALEGLPGDRHGVAYLNTRDTVLFIYNLVVPIVAAVDASDMEDFPFNPARLPLPDTIGRHLDKLVAAVRVDEEGMAVEGFSDGVDPLTFGGLLATHAPVYGPYVIEDFQEGLSHTRRSVLRRSRWPEQSEPLPPTQREFLQKYMRKGQKEFVCPLDRTPRDLGEGYKTSFLYFPEEFNVTLEWGGEGRWEERQKLDSELVLYEDRPRRGGRTVLTRAGNARFLSEDEFQKTLEAQKKKYGVE